MNIALFDLDHTLLPLDSDHEWIEFLSRHHYLRDPIGLQQRADELFRLYEAGQLKIEDSAPVMLSVLTEHSPAMLAKYHEEYMAEVIRPVISDVAIELVERHQHAGDLTCLVSATNTFVIAPIARAFGIPHVIGIDPEVVNGRFTGRYVGVPSYREGKIIRVEQWLQQLGYTLSDFEQSWFYSDSQNDIPLLERVTHPVATNPNPILRQRAQESGWPILSLFEGNK